MILEILSSTVVSGLVGTVGGYFTKKIELEAIDRQNQHDLDMLEAKTDATIRVAEAKIQEVKVHGELKVQEEEVKAFTESQKGSSLGNTIKSCVRPIILAFVGWMTYRNQEAVSMLIGGMEALPPSELIELFKVVVLSTFSLFAMGVGWYFGQRTTKQTDAFMGLLRRDKSLK